MSHGACSRFQLIRDGVQRRAIKVSICCKEDEQTELHVMSSECAFDQFQRTSLQLQSRMWKSISTQAVKSRDRRTVYHGITMLCYGLKVCRCKTTAVYGWTGTIRIRRSSSEIIGVAILLVVPVFEVAKIGAGGTIHLLLIGMPAQLKPNIMLYQLPPLADTFLHLRQYCSGVSSFLLVLSMRVGHPQKAMAGDVVILGWMYASR